MIQLSPVNQARQTHINSPLFTSACVLLLSRKRSEFESIVSVWLREVYNLIPTGKPGSTTKISQS